MKILVVLYISLAVWMLVEGDSQKGSSAPKKDAPRSHWKDVPLNSRPCEHEWRHYCLNGGTCFRLPGMGGHYCGCRMEGNFVYSGKRCEQLEPIGSENEN
ncbi:hypothetical protein ACROYT_G030754 [Oculina patagonica]